MDTGESRRFGDRDQVSRLLLCRMRATPGPRPPRGHAVSPGSTTSWSAPPSHGSSPRFDCTVPPGPVCMNSPDVPGEGRLDADGQAKPTLPRVDHVPRPGGPVRARIHPAAGPAGGRFRDPAQPDPVPRRRVAPALRRWPGLRRAGAPRSSRGSRPRAARARPAGRSPTGRRCAGPRPRPWPSACRRSSRRSSRSVPAGRR